MLAVILAFIFRSFEAEAFVIPTGSMAPTLMGRHIDVTCKECGYRYSSGASIENSDRNGGFVTQTSCPICRYPQTLARKNAGDGSNPNEDSFNGDRLIVDKVTYLLEDPQRWDVIVFRYPYNAKQNYIKRLVGLPNETIRIHNGDVFAKQDGESEFKILRKPPHKLRALLEIVDDSDHLATGLVEAEWPSRWQEWSKKPADRSWQIKREQNRKGYYHESYSNDGKSSNVAWLRYRHLVPNLDTWQNAPRTPITRAQIYDDRGIPDTAKVFSRVEVDSGFEGWDLTKDANYFQGQLITDYYPYNQNREVYPRARVETEVISDEEVVEVIQSSSAKVEPGYHWAGDLALECDVEIESESGALLLDLVEGGFHYTCTIDVSSGKATLEVSDKTVSFHDADGRPIESVNAETAVKGKGKYRLCLANADDELTLWVDDQVVKFDSPPRFNSPREMSPRWSSSDPGDAEPLGIGSRGCAMTVDRIRVYRDIYYLAIKSDGEPLIGLDSTDYADQFKTQDDMIQFIQENGKEDFLSALRNVIQTPSKWDSTDVFRKRRQVEFELAEGQYLPVGDNSPSSKDARVWGPEHYFDANLLIGKAQFVFWPHGWRRPIPYWPNFDRFRFVR